VEAEAAFWARIAYGEEVNGCRGASVTKLAVLAGATWEGVGPEIQRGGEQAVADTYAKASHSDSLLNAIRQAVEDEKQKVVVAVDRAIRVFQLALVSKGCALAVT